MLEKRALKIIGLLIAISVLAVSGCTSPAPSAQGKIRVAVSIPPLADFVRQVGGDRVEMELMVPPGASVHTYEPRPRQLQFMARAHVLVLNGVNLELWARKMVDSSGNPDLLVVDTSKGIAILAGGEEEDKHGDPHIWLNPVNALMQVEHIRDALIQVDPDGKEFYRQRAETYTKQLLALDREIQGQVDSWGHREFISFHSAWRYFAQRYGLEQVAVIEEFPGKEPSPEYLAEVVKIARAVGARAVFAEPQLPPRAAQAIAAESGKSVLILDPLGGVAGRETYIELMRYNVDQMERALK